MCTSSIHKLQNVDIFFLSSVLKFIGSTWNSAPASRARLLESATASQTALSLPCVSAQRSLPVAPLSAERVAFYSARIRTVWYKMRKANTYYFVTNGNRLVRRLFARAFPGTTSGVDGSAILTERAREVAGFT